VSAGRAPGAAGPRCPVTGRLSRLAWIPRAGDGRRGRDDGALVGSR
jgi:hypothetical protein